MFILTSSGILFSDLSSCNSFIEPEIQMQHKTEIKVNNKKRLRNSTKKSK